MTDKELFNRITTDEKVMYFHDQLALLDWKIEVSVKLRKIVQCTAKKYGERQPRQVTALKKYLKAEYGISKQ